MEAPKPAIPLDVVARMTRVLPHVEALGADVAGVEEGYGLMKADWREDLVGNPATGVLHGGVITALLDTASGIAVFTSVPSRHEIVSVCMSTISFTAFHVLSNALRLPVGLPEIIRGVLACSIKA